MASMFTEFDSYKLTKIKFTDEILGRGSYATVFEVKYKGQRCAGKKIHEVLLMQGNNSYAVRRFEEECRLLSRVHHPNIVQFIGLYFQRNTSVPTLIMEYLPTNLSTCIEKEGILAREICYSILCDVAEGFFYLHTQAPPIIHRDLSSNNVLLTSSMTAKISDLGVAKILDLTPLQVSHMTQTPGTPAYMPPEVMIADPNYDTSVDVFSYGILMIHVVCGRWPEPQVGQVRTVGDKLVPVSEAERRQVYLEAIEDDHPLKDLILSCVDNKPRLRPHVGEIKHMLTKLVQQFPRSGNYQPTFLTSAEADIKRKGKWKKLKAMYDFIVYKDESKVRKPTPAKEGRDRKLELSGSFEYQSVPVGGVDTSPSLPQIQSKVAGVNDMRKEGRDKKPGASTANTHPMYIVNYGYTSRACDDMSLKKGDKLCIISTDKKGWWFAQSLDTGKQGYIPSNYISELSCPVFTAAYDYQSCKDDELTFKKGDEFSIVHTGNGDWWFVRSRKTGCEGFIPRNYVTEVTYPIFAAMYDYDARTTDDLAFRKNDQLYIISADDRDWWLARSKDTGREGFIPSNYVAKVNSLNLHKWYFGDISRTESEKKLWEQGNQSGSYLIRQSETVLGCYSLSVRDKEGVRHYRIINDKELFFIVAHTSFKSIAELVSHYQQRSDGLCNRLIHPCVSLEKPQTVGLRKRDNDDWEINEREIRLVKKLGEGNYAQVWGGLWNGKTPVAVKVLKSKSMAESDFLQEASLMKRLYHPKLLQLFAVCTKNPPYYIITEFMKHGSLLDYLRSERRSLKLHQLISMAEQVAEGMAYLEEQKYIHRDLAARNVLVGDGLVCKIGDFGLTRFVTEAGCKANNYGTKFAIKWTAPEALVQNRFTVKSDVWSFGVVLYEIGTYGRFPYPSLTNQEVLDKLKQGYRMPQPKECSYMYYNIMLKCWREEPENRPTFEALQWELEDFLESNR